MLYTMQQLLKYNKDKYLEGTRAEVFHEQYGVTFKCYRAFFHTG